MGRAKHEMVFFYEPINYGQSAKLCMEIRNADDGAVLEQIAVVPGSSAAAGVMTPARGPIPADREIDLVVHSMRVNAMASGLSLSERDAQEDLDDG